MAVFTLLDQEEASGLAQAHSLGAIEAVEPIAAGSVNSNFFLRTTRGTFFCRIYEEQEADGVAYEWALLDHLQGKGVPVPQRIPGPGPGELRVKGKPTAVFERVGGRETCQAGVSEERARAVGSVLALCHDATDDFPLRREGRFGLAAVERRLDVIEGAGRPELSGAVVELRAAVAEVRARRSGTAPTGVVHGDLFRDNVRFEQDRVVALLDWESASDGDRVYDVMVTVLAWCYGDTLDWGLARALVGAYHVVRPLSSDSQGNLRLAALQAAVRFGATRITDYHLRDQGVGERVHKDYRRYLDRLRVVRHMSDDELLSRLLG